MRLHILSVLILTIFCRNAFAGSDPEELFRKADSMAGSNTRMAIHICDSMLQFSHHKPITKGKFHYTKAKAHYINGDYEKAGAAFTASRQSLESIPVTIELGNLYNEQAKLYRKLAMYPEALDIYNRAEKVFVTLTDTNLQASIINERGVVYELMGDYEKAIEHFEQSLQLKAVMKDSIGIAYAYSFLSNAYLEMNNISEAEKYALKSLELFNHIKAPLNEAHLNINTAMLYQYKKDYTRAISYLLRTEAITTEMGYKDMLSATYKYLADNYAQLHNYKTAYEYYQKYSSMKDSIFTANSQKTIAELNVQYQTAEKDKNLLQQQNRLSRQRLWLIVALLSLSAAIAMTFSIYRNKRLKEAKLRKEAEHKEEILRMEAAQNMQKDRLRISRDLHDNIGSYLTYINSTIDSLSDEQQHENSRISILKHITSETIAELRRTVWLINKPSVSIEEWIIKLREHYRKIPQILIESSLENPTFTLTALQATTLFRIIQEAVNNSLKYAEADRIMVKIQQSREQLEVFISDNGKGFNMENIQQGFGLDNMHQRAQEINGHCTIESSIAQGTKVKISMPTERNT